MSHPEPPPNSVLPPQAYPAPGGGNVGGGYPPPTAQPVGPQAVPTAQPVQPSRPIPVAQPTTPAAAPAPQPTYPRPGNRPVPVAPAGGLAVRQATPDEQAEEDAEQAPPVLKAAPPWLISLIVHIVILMVLALLFVHQAFDPPVEVVLDTYAEDEGEQLEEDVLDMAALDEVQFDEALLTPEDLKPVDDPFAAPPEMEITFDPNSSMSDVASPTIGLALTGREAGRKNALLAAYGGNATTEAAVADGLLWLKRNQKRDGSWSLKGPYQDGGITENQNAATAMALLAFQGAGHTHKVGEHKDVVAKGWAWLLKQQADNGSFVPRGVPDHHQLYTHAQATIALCELYGMTKDKAYHEPAKKAVQFAVNAQAEEGGWRYHPKQGSDTSVTGWFVMALQSAMMAGLEVPSPNLSNINKFLDTVAVDGGRRYRYRPNSHENLALSAEGLLCRQYLGWKHDDPRLVDGVKRFVSNPIDYSEQNVYYWYYGTQAAHHMEGELWDRWNVVMRQEIPEHQVKDGVEKGSWNTSDTDTHEQTTGRLYTTCLSIYMLEVYYRHLPIYAEVYKFKLQQF